jgi:D-citramalate synthase
MISGLRNEGIRRMMLPDTLGILDPDETYQFCSEMMDYYPEMAFDFHAHNDYDLAVANVFQALKAGMRCVHTTVNGLGERAGNVPLSSVMATATDHLNLISGVNETMLNRISKVVESFSGVRIPGNKPLIGDFVFTQCSGIHADGDSKNKLYYNELLPERFGRIRKYALGKTSGKANIRKNLEDLGIDLDAESLKKVTDRIIELADQKENVSSEDLPYIVADILSSESIGEKIKVRNYSIVHAMGLRPMASVSIEIGGVEYQESSSGDGQYDAFMCALRKIYTMLEKSFPTLVDYVVTIPPGGKSDALVETVITWQNGHEFKTRGLDSDQTTAAIKATVRMLNIIENDYSIHEH